jgi:hypothetical protein
MSAQKCQHRNVSSLDAFDALDALDALDDGDRTYNSSV